MDHQLLGQALGGTIFKIEIRSSRWKPSNPPPAHWPCGNQCSEPQLCSYPDTLPESVQVTHINLNDGIFPAMIATRLQYHPEASPGPHDSDQAYFDFVEMMKKNRSKA